MRKTLSLVVAAATMATALIPSASQAETTTELKWGACPADTSPGIPLPAGMQCTTLKVPLDHRNPNSQKIDVAVSRLASKDPAKRRGILLTNPGGPSAGLGYPATLVAAKLPQSVLDQYDVIGFDPRGIGHSTPVTCDLTAKQQLYGNIPPYAKNSAAVAERAVEVQQIAKQCWSSKTAGLLRHMSVADIARDMDQIRSALGEAKLSYLGASWGTHLGAVYTTLFPARSDRIVLDSNLVPGGWDYPSDRMFSQGVEDRFPDFAAYAAANFREYGLGRTPAQVTAKFHELAARLDKHPIPGDGIEIDGRMFRLLTFAYSFGATQMPVLAELWKSLDAGEPPAPPAAKTSSVAEGADQVISGRYAIICNSSRWPTSVKTYQKAVAVDRIRFPLFGAAGANIQPCAYWPNPTETPVQINDHGPANVLMVQNLRDPATPLAGARKMRQALGQRATMITADEGGHGVYLFGKNRCANYPVTTFLTTGVRPAHDYACSAEATPR